MMTRLIKIGILYQYLWRDYSPLFLVLEVGIGLKK